MNQHFSHCQNVQYRIAEHLKSADSVSFFETIRDMIRKGVSEIDDLVSHNLRVMELKAATVMYEELLNGPFAHRRVALLHGRLRAEERDDIMRDFRDGKVDVLVATTVIEVGIDVGNATVMIIEHPERFGLSQLHQLRGRVGRGAEQSYCILLGDVGIEAGERLALFASTEDGFEIARADLQLRGMGDLFGAKQHGLPAFRIADPLRDEALNETARVVAERVLREDPELTATAHQGLRHLLTVGYSRALELFRVG